MKMIPVETVEELRKGEIVLCGGYFYKILQVVPGGFKADVWEDGWRPLAFTVLFPQPGLVVHEVTEVHLFKEG